MAEKQIKDGFKKIGSRFAFEFFLEVWHDRIIDLIRKWLSNITLTEVRQSVELNTFPDTSRLKLSALTDYSEYLERINVHRFMEFIAEVRPDLALELQDMGQKGAIYVVKLHAHLLDLIKHPEKNIAPATSKIDMIQHKV